MKSKLLKGYIDNFGELLGKAWETKKKFSPKITNQYFDEIYDFALKNGALGGKLLGAGSGGYYLFYVPTFKKLSLIKLLEERGLKTESITFDNIGLRQWITKKKV
jgi:D-glycero-alpha-D-manno-heptose-7-phosphate kinase